MAPSFETWQLTSPMTTTALWYTGNKEDVILFIRVINMTQFLHFYTCNTDDTIFTQVIRSMLESCH